MVPIGLSVLKTIVRRGAVHASALSIALTAPAAAAGLDDLLKSLAGPKIEVSIVHPPSIASKVTPIAIARPKGRCAESLATRIEADFAQSGAAMIDRRRLEEVAAEHSLQGTRAIDEKTAARVGQLLGAQALLFLDVAQCHATNSKREAHRDKDTGRIVYEYVTHADLNGSLRVVNLTSGVVMAAQRFEGSAGFSSEQGYPDRDATLAEAEKSATDSVHKLLLPWIETKSLSFYDDAQCELKATHRLLRANDIDGAFRQAQASLNICQGRAGVKPIALARAHYNFGMIQFLKRDYDGALANLTEADELQSSKVFLDAIADCRRAKELAAALAHYESGPTSPVATAGASSKVLTGKPATTELPEREPAAGASIEQRLSRLDDLLKKKVISQEEYDRQRAQILSEI